MPSDRIVADTNILISRLLLPDSTSAKAMRKALNQAQLLVSAATLGESADVLSRRKFDSYVSLKDREQFIRLLSRTAEWIIVTYPVKACRDSKEDKFLEVALNGTADLVITGDKDLLALHPFRKIDILTPREYLERG